MLGTVRGGGNRGRLDIGHQHTEEISSSLLQDSGVIIIEK
jgi:hypothetical protein